MIICHCESQLSFLISSWVCQRLVYDSWLLPHTSYSHSHLIRSQSKVILFNLYLNYFKSVQSFIPPPLSLDHRFFISNLISYSTFTNQVLFKKGIADRGRYHSWTAEVSSSLASHRLRNQGFFPWLFLKVLSFILNCALPRRPTASTSPWTLKELVRQYFLICKNIQALRSRWLVPTNSYHSIFQSFGKKHSSMDSLPPQFLDCSFSLWLMCQAVTTES